jgi:hypothetical protein
LSVEEVSEVIMGVDSPYSIENQRIENLSVDYLQKLNAKESNGALANELDQLETKISDPAMRALLQMKRLEKETNS